MRNQTHVPGIFLLLAICISALLLGACSSGSGSPSGTASAGDDAAEDDRPLRDNTPKVYTPVAEQTTTYEADEFSVDASNTAQGYVMVRYSGDKDNEKIQIAGPDGSKYTYTLVPDGEYYAFPLTAGDGGYTVIVYDNAYDNQYATVLTQELDVSLTDEFLPFLYANQYVGFTESSSSVSKAKELASSAHSDLEVIGAVYDFITGTITYDHDKAGTANEGGLANYLPDPDRTLSEGTGICLDYASLMTAMLRSQGIPTKLEVGDYTTEDSTVYHAWISTYADDKGWVDNIISFDGNTWKLMDPTNAAANDTVDYATSGDTSYVLKYSY